VLINPARNPSIFRRRFPIRLWYPNQHLLRQNPLPRSQFGSRRGCPAQHELPAARDGAGNPIEVVGAWSDEGDEWGVGRGGAGGAVGACRISRAADSGAICLAAVTMGGKQAHPTLTPGTF